ncbi:MAG: hypothetical protein ACK6CT_03260 [Planctomycetia bacterium]
MHTHLSIRSRRRMPRKRKETIDREPFRTGTALRVPRWMPATAAFALAGVLGLAQATVDANAADTFADNTRPGAIGAQRRPQPGPRPETELPPAVQPVAIHGPPGLRIAIETASGWSPLQLGTLRMGLVVGQAYRLRVAGIPGREGEELFPTVRILARLATPPGTAWRFPVEVVIDADDLAAAAEGAHVRRVVYLACDSSRPDVVAAKWFDVRPGDDALDVARTLGEPVAELVIGNRLPASTP